MLPLRFPTRSLRRLLPLGALLAAACATPPAAQDVQRFYPDSEQLLSRTARLVEADGTTVRHGVSESFYPDGHPQSRASFVFGTPDGDFLQWHANGTPSCKGRYAMGRRNGEWTLWNEHGVMREQSRWRDGILEGDVSAWDDDGHVAWTGHFAHGHRDGAFVAYHANGRMRVRGTFAAGEPAGRFTAWYADGTMADEGRYKDGRPSGTWICWNPAGQQVLAVSLHGSTSVPSELPDALGWNGEHAPAADPFDLAAVFVSRPADDEPEQPAVVLAPTRKPALKAMTVRNPPPQAVEDEPIHGAPAHVGVH